MSTPEWYDGHRVVGHYLVRCATCSEVFICPIIQQHIGRLAAAVQIDRIDFEAHLLSHEMGTR